MYMQDEKINQLLQRSKNYRNNLLKTFQPFEDFSLDENLPKLLRKDNFNVEDKKNIFLQCKITKEEANKGCKKKLKYIRKNELNKKEKNVISLKIPSNINETQKIIIYNEGNYIEKNTRGNLVINIKIT